MNATSCAWCIELRLKFSKRFYWISCQNEYCHKCKRKISFYSFESPLDAPKIYFEVKWSTIESWLRWKMTWNLHIQTQWRDSVGIMHYLRWFSMIVYNHLKLWPIWPCSNLKLIKSQIIIIFVLLPVDLSLSLSLRHNWEIEVWKSSQMASSNALNFASKHALITQYCMQQLLTDNNINVILPDTEQPANCLSHVRIWKKKNYHVISWLYSLQ